MLTTLRSLIALIALLAPALAQAGWVVEWSTTATNSKGEKLPSQQATQSIAENRVRMDQPEVVTITDYGTNRFTMLNPEKQYFWSGTLDEYVRDMSAARERSLRERIGQLTGKKAEGEVSANPTPVVVDESKLPPVSITPAGTSETIAGYEAQKYEVKINGELFEEMWIAPIDLSADLNFDRFMAQQLKNSAAMKGKAANSYNALYRSPEYRRLVEKALVVKNVTHHLSGSFERTATGIAQRDVPASAFAVPESYRKVRLADLLGPAPQTNAPTSPSSGGQSN
jgi:hypothetical protein